MMMNKVYKLFLTLKQTALRKQRLKWQKETQMD
jgi:hypothetical protein